MEEGGCLSIAGGWADHRQVEAVRVLRVRGHPRWRKESKGAVPVGAWRECAQLCQHGKSEAGVGRNSSSKRFKKNSLANVRAMPEIRDACCYGARGFKGQALPLVPASGSEAVC